jgi:cytochrome c553
MLDMNKRVGFSVLALAAVAVAGSPAVGLESPPPWAYVLNPPGFQPPADDGRTRHVPDSAAAFTLTQARDLFLAPDWHPSDHPPMPDVVAHGRKPGVYACGFCHRADGPGGPENSSLAGLPAPYIIQQMAEFRSGARATSVPERDPSRFMIAVSRAVTDAEVAASAGYFSALRPRRNISVVETASVPRTFVAGWHLAAVRSGDREPLGRRVVEVPEDLERFESRDARARFIAYVPRGSVEVGRALAATGGDGRTLPCSTCHGPALRGLGPVPGIAGRSPSYLVRQLYDLKHGARAGASSGLMLPAVQKLTIDDMISLAAYAASLEP